MNAVHIPEKFIRDVWQRQIFTKDGLQTSDGRQVGIIRPGTPNPDAGPDFTGARIRIGNITFYGDVEIHANAASWRAHGHDSDPHYNRVILHVVMTLDHLAPPDLTSSRRHVPVLVLHPFLDRTLFSAWLRNFSDRETEQELACFKFNDRVPVEIIQDTLERLAGQRIELKVRRFEERLKGLIDEGRLILREPYPRYYDNPGDIPVPGERYNQKDLARKEHWEQLLFEGILEGLGYSKNQEPFLGLAQSMRLHILRQFPLDNAQTMMALLFGAAGLLPSTRTLKDKESRVIVRALRKEWRAFRPSFRGPILSPGDWKFFRLRPSNFPTARLAAFCHLLPSLFNEDGFRRLISIFKSDGSTHQTRLGQIHDLFAFTPDNYWQHHYTFGRNSPGAVVKLGDSRILELVVNVIIPIVLLYARMFKDSNMRANAQALLKKLPEENENSVSKLVKRQLLKNRLTVKSAFTHQGLLQLYRFYCTPIRCGECEIGKVCLPP